MNRPAFFGAGLLAVCALPAQAQDAPPAALRFDVVPD
jgi:hypothetical protein